MIRFCGNNEEALGVACRLERGFPKLVVRVEPCLKKCGPCKEKPFALLDGEMITAADGDGLFLELLERLHLHPR